MYGIYYKLTVLNIGGVSMGSFSSKMIEACASILAIFGTEIFGLIENTTKPSPLVPLFGGKKPILGSDGAAPEGMVDQTKIALIIL